MVTKTSQRVITQGIKAVSQAFDITDIFKVANRLHSDENYFLSFKKKDGKTYVTDGNYEILEILNYIVPEDMFCIRDDFDEHYVVTLMLSYEY